MKRLDGRTPVAAAAVGDGGGVLRFLLDLDLQQGLLLVGETDRLRGLVAAVGAVVAVLDEEE